MFTLNDEISSTISFNAPGLSFNVIKIDDLEYAHIVEYDDMNATFEVQDQSLDWLDSVSHLLEDYGAAVRMHSRALRWNLNNF